MRKKGAGFRWTRPPSEMARADRASTGYRRELAYGLDKLNGTSVVDLGWTDRTNHKDLVRPAAM
jgi:hypothetical protein